MDALIIDANMKVCNGNVKPLPIVDIIFRGTTSSSNVVCVDRISVKVSKNQAGKNFLHILMEMESEAADKSIVATDPSREPCRANSRFASGCV